MELKERIITETHRLLTIKSCKVITMDEIANNLGISKRTLYENFSDKTTLLKECLDKHFETNHKEVQQIINTSENALIALMLLIKKLNTKISKISYDNFLELKKFYTEVHKETFSKHFEKHQGTLLNWLKKAVEEDLLLKEIDLQVLITMIMMNLLQCSKQDYLIHNPQHTRFSLSTLHLFIIIRGVATLKGVEIIDKYKKEFLTVKNNI